MADEPLHEIQLNGKQLVFLFMSATVVAVVIFLSGVMVGRGIQAPRVDVADAATDSTIDPTALPPSSAITSTESTPATAQETLTYASRLESETPLPETLKDPTAAPAALPAPVREPVTSAPPAPVAAAPATPEPSKAAAASPKTAAPAAAAVTKEPPGNGFVVQVAATKQRSEADTIARRLAGKGYPAFVTTPASGPTMFRVRVGKYKDRREAETVATKLEREEQFKPWVTR
jgi:cell division septation protein DedD